MTTEAAVATPPAATETKAAPAGETKAPLTEGTGGGVLPIDGKTAVQAGGSDGDAKTGEETPTEHAAKLEADVRAAEDKRLDDLAEQKAAAKLERERAEATDKERRERARKRFDTNITAMDRLLDEVESLEELRGSDVRLNRNAFKSLIESLHQDGSTAWAELAQEEWDGEIASLLGDGAKGYTDELGKRGDIKGKELARAKLALAVKHAALGSDAVKHADPEDLTKANSKLAKARADEKVEEYKKGVAFGQGLPAGEPGSNGNRGAGASGGPLTYTAYMDMTPSERRAVKPDEVQRIMREESGRRGGGR